MRYFILKGLNTSIKYKKIETETITNTVKVLLRLKTSVIFAMAWYGILLAIGNIATAGYNLTVYVRRAILSAILGARWGSQHKMATSTVARRDYIFYTTERWEMGVQVCISNYLLGIDNCVSYGANGSDFTLVGCISWKFDWFNMKIGILVGGRFRWLPAILPEA